MGEKSGDITITTVPDGWNVYMIGSTCNYGSIQSYSLKNNSTLTLKCINLSNGTHSLTGTVYLLYSPSYMLP